MTTLDLTTLDDGDLDELVHAVASQQASNVNNGGTSEQLNWLMIQGWSEQEIRDWLADQA